MQEAAMRHFLLFADPFDETNPSRGQSFHGAATPRIVP